MQLLRPRLAALGMQRHGGAWQALANITDGRETYELILTLTQTRGRWFVSSRRRAVMVTRTHTGRRQ